MDRPEHWLTPLRGGRIPTQHLAVHVDGEGGPEPGMPRTSRERLRSWECVRWRYAGGEVVRQAVMAGSTADQWWQTLAASVHSGGVTWVWCCDALRAVTLLDLWGRVERGDAHLCGRVHHDAADPDAAPDPDGAGYCVVDAPPTIIQFGLAGRGGRVCWVDLRNYGEVGPNSLPPVDTEAGRVAEWVRRWIGLVRTEGLGSLAVTAGAQAWAAFRRRLLTHPVFVHRHPYALSLERSAYLGGRNEAFRLGEIPGPVYHLDVRSMYPHAYGTRRLPVELVGYEDGEPSPQALAAVREGAACAEVVLRTDAASYPAARFQAPDGSVLPLDAAGPLPRRGDRRLLVFPVGTYRTALCGPELLDAYARGRILAWRRVSWYRMAPVLQAYSRALFALRQRCRERSEPGLEAAVKQMLVALPGKFGQESREWVYDAARIARAPYSVWSAVLADGTVERWRSLAWRTQREERGGEAYHSVPSIAAWITALGRYHLLGLLRACGRADCYYTDHDSLICAPAGYDRLCAAGAVADGELGKLRVLGRHQTCVIHGLKHYELDGKTTCAGLPLPGAVRRATAAQVWARESPRSALGQESRPAVRSHRGPAARRREYRHGRVGGDGRVYPLELTEEVRRGAEAAERAGLQRPGGNTPDPDAAGRVVVEV